VEEARQGDHDLRAPSLPAVLPVGVDLGVEPAVGDRLGSRLVPATQVEGATFYEVHVPQKVKEAPGGGRSRLLLMISTAHQACRRIPMDTYPILPTHLSGRKTRARRIPVSFSFDERVVEMLKKQAEGNNISRVVENLLVQALGIRHPEAPQVDGDTGSRLQNDPSTVL